MCCPTSPYFRVRLFIHSGKTTNTLSEISCFPIPFSIFYHQYFAPMRAAILVSDHPQLLTCVCYTFYPPPLCHPSVFYYHFSRHCWSGDFIEWRFIPGSWCLRHRPSKNKQQFFSPKSLWRLARYRSPCLSLTFIALLIFTSPSLHFHHLLSFPGYGAVLPGFI